MPRARALAAAWMKRQLREAREAAQAGDWSRAASLYAAVATSAAQAGDRDLSQQSWAQAGDALQVMLAGPR